MLKFVILLSAMACALGAAIPEGMLALSQEGRIIGGTPTSINNYPYTVSVQRSGSHICGGSIHSNYIIITAAHCLQHTDHTVLKIRAGSTYWNSGGVLVNLASYKIHGTYDPNTKANDIAVARLASGLSMSSTIRSIAPATSTPNNGADAVITGWGTKQYGNPGGIPNQLHYANLKIVGRSQCASSSYGYGDRITHTMICAYTPGKDACQGDSGGPLVSGGQLVGVTSWGQGCAFNGYPGVYSNVADLRNWINNNT